MTGPTGRPSPLRNRVAPCGEIVAAPARGTMMGNRGGRLHDPLTGRLEERRFISRRWICCRLHYKDRRRTVFGAGYTELFFLDEATALAAGHRPCFECRREDAARFLRACGHQRADDLDRALHVERLRPMAERPWIALADPPDGAFVRCGAETILAWGGRLHRWTFAGYTLTRSAAGGHGRLMTPPTVMAALAQGYRPAIHPSAEAGRSA